MSKVKDLSGQRFGRLIVAEQVGRTQKGDVLWKCLCDCGGTKVVRGYTLQSGKTQSCGCLHSEITARVNRETKTTHGETHTRLYSIWRGMKIRCLVKSSKHYKDYGGRGIKICAEWIDSFELFKAWSVNNGYQDNLTIDRINNDGNYEPSNCRWTTMSVQNSNRRRYKKRGKYQ